MGTREDGNGKWSAEPEHESVLAGPTRAETERLLSALLEAYNCSRHLNRNVWDFAVELESLEESSLTRCALRLLVCEGYVQHAREMTPVDDQLRSFRPNPKLTFKPRTCFILTDAGVGLAKSLYKFTTNVQLADQNVGQAPDETSEELLPEWDSARQELRWCGNVVKRFKVPAPNQELVLAVFHEEGWPVRIDDPLPQRPELDPKRRLHDTINALNRRQIEPLLRFLGDGKGTGILWKPSNVAQLA